MPSTYIVHSHYIASQVMAGTFVDISGTTALIFLAAGVLCVYVNYDADLQVGISLGATLSIYRHGWLRSMRDRRLMAHWPCCFIVSPQ